MFYMSKTAISGLTTSQVESFIEDGFVRIDNAFPTDLASQCQDELWAAMGLSPDRAEDWTQPVIRIPSMSTPAFIRAANTLILHRAYDQLVGPDRWLEPQGMGSFPIRFPSQIAPGDDGWHVDASFGDGADFMEWRANVKSSRRALLMLFLFSDVGADDAPTRIRKGSHAIIARELLAYGLYGATLRELSADGYASSERCHEALAMGEAGTVYLCHPFLVHAAQAHRGTRPRFMAQPPLLPKGEIDPALAPSPVQVAIRKACGLAL
jgi:hypothetical protein